MPPGRVKKSQEIQKRISSVSFQAERRGGVWSEVIRPDQLDVSFICEDAVRVRGHQAVLAMSSTHLHQVFRTSAVKTGGGDWLRSTDLEVSLPGVRSDILCRILSLLYCGLMEVKGKTMLKEIRFVWDKILKIDLVKLNNREDINVLPPGEGKSSQEYNNVQKNMFLISNRDPEEKTIFANPAVSSEPEVDQDVVEDSTSDTENIQPVIESLMAENDDGAYNIVVPPSLNVKRKTSPTLEILDQSEIVQQSESRVPKKKLKTTTTAASYSVEEIHTCLICNGKKDGKIDKEASELSFANSKIKKLKEHYSKHFYTEGRIVRAFPPEENNIDTDGKIIDEFGKQFIYKCEEENCWKSKIKKQGFGYKEIALHHAAEHGLFEKIARCDEREKIRNLLQHVKLNLSHN